MVEERPYNRKDSQQVNSIEVQVYRKPNDRHTILAIVTASQQTASDNVTWNKVVDKEPMGFEEAMDRARIFAEQTGINLILWRDDTVSHFWCHRCDRYVPRDEIVTPSKPLSPTEPMKPANLCPECDQLLTFRTGLPQE